MRIKTVNQLNIHDKRKVLFVSHPSDFSRYYDLLSDEILSARDCAVYHYEDGVLPSAEDWQSDLREINLLVIPITAHFLGENSPAMDMYVFAQDTNIPVLPIMVEPDQEQTFNDVCGQKQLLDRTNQSPTSIPYLKKLEDFLSSVLASTETVQKIYDMFDTQLFLSYRQQDRKYVQQLMRTIHENEFTRDVAIWYDEFLRPDENFNDAILDAIKTSDLFVLAITHNLVKENNYVIRDEYPAALREGKRILPVVLEKLAEEDQILLRKSFPDLPDCIDIHGRAAFAEALRQALPKPTERSATDESEHTYYIGLAFLHGIKVEMDREKGVELLSEAAQQGVADAAKELVRMYYYGVMVRADLAKAISWQKSLISILDRRYAIKKSISDVALNVYGFEMPLDNKFAGLLLDLADALRYLTELERNAVTYDNMDTIEDMIDCCMQALSYCNYLCRHYELMDAAALSRYVDCQAETHRALGILYEKNEDYNQALDAYQVSLEIRRTIAKYDEELGDEELDVNNQWHLATLHHDIGVLYHKQGNNRTAIAELKKSLDFYRTIREKTPAYLTEEADTHRDLSSVAVSIDPALAEQHSILCRNMIENMDKKMAALTEAHYASALLHQAIVLSEHGSMDYSEQERLCRQAILLYKRNLSAGSHTISFGYANALYKLAGIHRKTNDLYAAAEYYRKAIAVVSGLLDSCDTEEKLTAAHMFFDYGTCLLGGANLSIEVEKGGVDAAAEYLRKALALYEKTGSAGCEYADETRKVLTEIGNCHNRSDNPTSKAQLDTALLLGNLIATTSKGEAAENAGYYEKAYLIYQSAWEQYSELEQLLGEETKNEQYELKYELLDRLAVCAEMMGNLSAAYQHYTNSAEVAYDIMLNSLMGDDFGRLLNANQKVESFCKDYGFETDHNLIARREQIVADAMAHANDAEDDDPVILELTDPDGTTSSYR